MIILINILLIYYMQLFILYIDYIDVIMRLIFKNYIKRFSIDDNLMIILLPLKSHIDIDDFSMNILIVIN